MTNVERKMVAELPKLEEDALIAAREQTDMLKFNF